jgi:hypothetical protein
MAVGYNPRAITDGLVLALDAGNTKSYSGSGTTWTDNVGGNNGTLTNGPYHTKGPFFSSGSVYFDDTSKYLDISSSSDFAYGTGDFTWECWVYIIQGGYALDHGSNGGTIVLSHTSVSLYYNTTVGTGSVLYTTGFGTIPTETWTHIAAVRSGGTTYLYTNGVLSSSASDSHNYGSQAVRIGQYGGGGSNYFGGYISDLRIVKGTAVYTSAFTPPTGPLTAVTNTKLLTCQGNTITDASSSAHSISVTGGAEANLGFPKSAFVFDGSNDYVDIGASSDFNFGTGNFTIEGWVNTSTTSIDNGAFRRFFKLDGPSVYNATGQLEFSIENTNGNLYISGNSLGYNSSASVANGSWNHFAVTRISNTIYVYVNGASAGSVSYSGSFSPNSGSPRPRIGAYTSSEGRFNGKVSALKIYKGKGLTADEVSQNYNALKGRYA